MCRYRRYSVYFTIERNASECAHGGCQVQSGAKGGGKPPLSNKGYNRGPMTCTRQGRRFHFGVRVSALGSAELLSRKERVPMIADERRITPRYPFYASAEIFDQQQESRMRSRVRDLSLGGCYVETPDPLPAGKNVVI